MSGPVMTTPRSKAECRRLGIDLVALAERVPDGCLLTFNYVGGGQPWFVRLWGLGEPEPKVAAHSADLGHAIEYVLTAVSDA